MARAAPTLRGGDVSPLDVVPDVIPWQEQRRRSETATGCASGSNIYMRAAPTLRGGDTNRQGVRATEQRAAPTLRDGDFGCSYGTHTPE
jgi:hypothetical protein